MSFCPDTKSPGRCEADGEGALQLVANVAVAHGDVGVADIARQFECRVGDFLSRGRVERAIDESGRLELLPGQPDEDFARAVGDGQRQHPALIAAHRVQLDRIGKRGGVEEGKRREARLGVLDLFGRHLLVQIKTQETAVLDPFHEIG